MKKIFFLFFVSATLGNMNAQKLHTEWKQQVKKVSATEYDLIFTVKIEKGWHIYSQKVSDGPNPTEIKFTASNDYEIVGATKESKPIEMYDKVFEAKLAYFENQAVFTTRIKVKKAGAVIKGTYQYQVCDDGACQFPPYENFEFKIPAK